MPPYYITPQAEQDLDELALYIARDNPKAALRLYDMAKETFESLSETPLIGATYKAAYQRLEVIRFCAIKNFERYIIFYEPLDKGIRIVRILHNARDLAPILT